MDTAQLQEARRRLAEALAKVPRKPLGKWPTPLEPIQGMSGALVKREDLASDVYGGNKLRKLEFLLGDPSCEKAKVIISMGGVGSHHLEALSLFKREDQELIALLFPQPASEKVWKTLGVLLDRGVRLVGVKSELEMAARALAIQAEETLKGNRPYLITPGGSTPLGIFGWVEGALETVEQAYAQGFGEIAAHVAPAGSLGTVVGLRIGLAMIGEKTSLIAVRVATEGFVNRPMIETLTTATLARLWALGVKPPDLSCVEMELEEAYLGDGYGYETAEALRAKELAPKLLGLGLEGTYSAKTFACFLDRFGKGLPQGRPAVFYQTYNQIPHTGWPEDKVRRHLANNPAVKIAIEMAGETVA